MVSHALIPLIRSLLLPRDSVVTVPANRSAWLGCSVRSPRLRIATRPRNSAFPLLGITSRSLPFLLLGLSTRSLPLLPLVLPFRPHNSASPSDLTTRSLRSPHSPPHGHQLLPRRRLEPGERRQDENLYVSPRYTSRRKLILWFTRVFTPHLASFALFAFFPLSPSSRLASPRHARLRTTRLASLCPPRLPVRRLPLVQLARARCTPQGNATTTCPPRTGISRATTGSR